MIDIELLKKERKQWRENSLLQSKSILRLSQELDNLRKQKVHFLLQTSIKLNSIHVGIGTPLWNGTTSTNPDLLLRFFFIVSLGSMDIL